MTRFRERRNLLPLARVRAREATRPDLSVASALDVWNAWQRFKAAQAAALAGGEFDRMGELHDEWLRLSKLWLNAPTCHLVSD